MVQRDQEAVVAAAWLAVRASLDSALFNDRNCQLAGLARVGRECGALPDEIDDNPKNHSAQIQHPAEDHPILRLSPTGWDLRQGQVSTN